MEKTKRKGLAGRSMERRNASKKSYDRKQDLMMSINEQDSVSDCLPIKETILPKDSMPRGAEVYRSSEPWTDPETTPWISPETQRLSDPLNCRSSDPENQRCKDSENHRTSDPESQTLLPALDLSKKPSDLTKEQFEILHFVYFSRPFKVRSDKGLAIGDLLDSPMTASNVRNRLKSLVNKGYIGKPCSVNDGISQGSTCSVNIVKCLKIFGPSGLVVDEHVGNRSFAPELHRSSDPESKRLRDPEHSLYSSSGFNKTTTTKTDIDLSDPELSFWLDHGLTEKTVKNVMNDCNITEFAVMASFKHAAFDMVVNKRIEKIKLKNPINYFFAVMKKTGFYPKPVNYKSHLQILIEQEEAEKQRLVLETRYYENLIREKHDARINRDLKRILADPEGELYNKCFSKLPGIRKDKFKDPSVRRGALFEMDMKIAYEKIYETEKEEDGIQGLGNDSEISQDSEKVDIVSDVIDEEMIKK